MDQPRPHRCLAGVDAWQMWGATRLPELSHRDGARIAPSLPLAPGQTEGFLDSVLQMMGLLFPSPDRIMLLRRNATIALKQQFDHMSQDPISLIVDSSGLRARSQDKWHTQKHSNKQHRCWKKWLFAILLTIDLRGCKSHYSQIKRYGAWCENSNVFKALEGLRGCALQGDTVSGMLDARTSPSFHHREPPQWPILHRSKPS